jgi:hypothetical protein
MVTYAPYFTICALGGGLAIVLICVFSKVNARKN